MGERFRAAPKSPRLIQRKRCAFMSALTKFFHPAHLIF